MNFANPNPYPGVTIPSHYAVNYNTSAASNDFYHSSTVSTGAFNSTYKAGFLLSEFSSPATTISLWEVVGSGNKLGDASNGKLYAGHLSTSNYLFVDGHVKSMRPKATIANNTCMWYRVDQTAAPYGWLNTALDTAETTYP